MQVYLTVTPAQTQEAAGYGRSLAHDAYSIGAGSVLLRRSLLLQTRGGLLCASDRDAPPIAEPQQLCAGVLRECSRRGYSGVLLAFARPVSRDRLQFVQTLAESLSAGRRLLYVPEAYAAAAPGGGVLIGTAVSGGSFRQRLEEAGQAVGIQRLALCAERLRMDFRLPSPTGVGTPISAQALQQLLEEARPSVFFSPELCARYFTYDREGETHFVLFDDGDTLNRKLRMGAAMGCRAAFLEFSQVQDLLPVLFPSGR